MAELSPVLPLGLSASWHLGEARARGRPASIQVADIVAAGVELADAEGLAAVSMPSVARRVGVTQNALYRHVVSKDELLVLMADAASGDPPTLDTSHGWRPAARSWAQALIDRYQAHPWLLDVRFRAPFTRNIVRWTEAFLAATRATGLPVAQRIECALLIDGHTRHVAAVRRDLATQGPLYGEAFITILVPLLEANGCPEFATFVRDSTTAPPDPDAGPEDFGLERILDGIAVLVDNPT